MMRHIALLVSVAVCLAGCGQQAAREEEAVNTILKLGGHVRRGFCQQVVEVILMDTQITDSDLKDLKELKALQELWLDDTRITDAGLKELKELKGLKTLGLRGTKITDAGLKDLKQALPATTITP